ncbi:hypothetical protein AB6A40_008646 [Gnathostoma spinigerum]|uniref:Uncharacterized protein n=1 Tax=Gnathostoma spinigerum TaxID=75299 RepID=A0ABD6EZ77_9BILA
MNGASGRELYRIPIVIATNESLEGYGLLTELSEKDTDDIIKSEWPSQFGRKPEGGDSGEITNENFVISHNINGAFCAQDKQIARKCGKRSYAILDDLRARLDGEVVYYRTVESAFIIVMMHLHSDEDGDESPKIISFLFDGHNGVKIYPQIAHSLPFPTEGNGTFILKSRKV